MKIAVIIPALDEEGSIHSVVSGLDNELKRLGHQPKIIVGDNGSKDRTRVVAEGAGALVVEAKRRGYGSACLAAMNALRDEEIVIFADGDAADDPKDLEALIEPILEEGADMVIGSRALGERLGIVEPGALTAPQRFGNGLATLLLRVGYGVVFTDLGPFRAIKMDALDALKMDDRDFGWTVQMQARAARINLKTREIPVHYRVRRAGVSKVAGNLKGSFMAGTIILTTLAKELRFASGHKSSIHKKI